MFSGLLQRFKGRAALPTLLHLTHAKAGSTWITVVLHELFGERVAPRGRKVAEASGGDLAQHVFEPGRVYPAMFMTREQVLAHPELNGCKRFVVIRDLRDTTTALFFSLKMAQVSEASALNECDEETGLLHILDARIADIAAIQSSWLKQGEIVLRYEDLIGNAHGLLRDAFIWRLGLPVSERALARAIRCAPVDRKAGAFDWRNHFTPDIRARFSARHGQLLIDAGYEKDFAWAGAPSSTRSSAGL